MGNIPLRHRVFHVFRNRGNVFRTREGVSRPCVTFPGQEYSSPAMVPFSGQGYRFPARGPVFWSAERFPVRGTVKESDWGKNPIRQQKNPIRQQKNPIRIRG